MYYIYHIEDIKIGCTTQPIKRTKEQGFLEYNILETHTDIYIASDREIELQKQYGLPVDKMPYWKSYQALRNGTTTKSSSDGGKTCGNINKQSGHIKKLGLTYGKINGDNNVKTGHIQKLGKQRSSLLNKTIITCPHCNKNGNFPNMKRWHFDNCKYA